jgi:hypothetical protein
MFFALGLSGLTPFLCKKVQKEALPKEKLSTLPHWL